MNIGALQESDASSNKTRKQKLFMATEGWERLKLIHEELLWQVAEENCFEKYEAIEMDFCVQLFPSGLCLYVTFKISLAYSFNAKYFTKKPLKIYML